MEGREPGLGLTRCWGVDGRETEAACSCEDCTSFKSCWLVAHHETEYRQTLAVDNCKAGLRSLAALIVAMLLASASPRGALASHSSIVRVDLGCGERMFKAGVLERLTAMDAAPPQRHGLGGAKQRRNGLYKDLILSQQPISKEKSNHVFAFSYRASNVEWSLTYHGSARFPWRLSLASVII